MNREYFIGIFIGIFVIGCTMPVKPVDLTSQDKIAVVIDLRDTFNYKDYGFGLFGKVKSEAQYPVSWGVSEVVAGKITMDVKEENANKFEIIKDRYPSVFMLGHWVAWAKEKGYSYLLFIENGHYCNDEMCNEEFYGFGSMKGILTLGVSYQLVNTETNQTHYQREIFTQSENLYGRFSTDEKVVAKLEEPILCLLQENIQLAKEELNIVYPLFEEATAPSPYNSVGTQFFSNHDCS